jgi:predicted Ser/Thr protein kinase
MSADHRSANDPLIGQEVGEYKIVRVLGRGGMGVVYEAEDTALGITVAVKMIDPALARDAAFVRRFRAEARAMARVASPHIVRVMAMRQTDQGVFIVMEFVDGGTVHDRMQSGPLPWEAVYPLVRQMLLALEKAHDVGVVHRDMKPRNIMLTADGTVKVTDFGLAKVVTEDDAATVTQAVAGTLLYMSPEQVRASPSIDRRSDLFALGLMMYEMLAGRLPFDRDAGEFAVMRAIVEESFPPPTKFVPGIPSNVARGVMKALEKDPDKRYANAAEMREALDRVAPAEPQAIGGRSGRDNRAARRLAVAGAAALAVVLLAAAILWVVLPAGDDFPETGSLIVATPPEDGTLSLDAPTDVPLLTDEPRATEPEARTPAVERQPVTRNPATEPTAPRAEPTPPPPAPGMISVAERSGLVYSIGGTRVDGSRSLAPGTYTVQCASGGMSSETRIRVRSGETANVTCHTEQTVNVSAAFEDGPSSWVAVRVNGANAGQTPTRLTLGPGRHSVGVQRDGYEVLTSDQVIEVRPSFEPLPVQRLSFRVRPVQ